jgi:hypothetical protein
MITKNRFYFCIFRKLIIDNHGDFDQSFNLGNVSGGFGSAASGNFGTSASSSAAKNDLYIYMSNTKNRHRNRKSDPNSMELIFCKNAFFEPYRSYTAVLNASPNIVQLFFASLLRL